MKRLFIITLLLPMLAFADHHRGHAQTHLAKVQDEMTAAIARLDRVTERCPVSTWPEFHQGKFDVILSYSHAALSDAEYADSLLDDPLVDLDGVLILVNAPNDGPNYHPYFEHLTWSGKRLSIADRIKTVAIMSFGLDYRLKVDGYECSDASVLSAVPDMTEAWQALDNAIWHVTDAIREEVYLDPDQICAGPNNHCE